MTEDFDALEWEALEPSRPQQSIDRPDVTITLTKRQHKPHRPPPRATATLWMRGKVGHWIATNGPCFNAEMSGAECLRLVAAPGGRFKAIDWRGTKRIALGHVNFWPNEARTEVSVEFWLRTGYIVMKLPGGFAKPSRPARDVNGAKGPFLVDIGGVQFTKDEQTVLKVLLKNTSSEAIPKNVSIDRLRVKIKPLGISIETTFGGGFRLDAASKARLRTLFERAAQ
jgi:hypothetical protein